MGMFTGQVTCHRATPSMTARDVAKEFAANFSDEGRRVGKTRNNGEGFEFKLVDGNRWYRAVPTPGCVWEITVCD